jgi:hypothetical protein
MEPVEGVESVPKSRWKLVSERSECLYHMLMFLELLYLQAKNGCLYPMQQQKLLPGISRYLWSPSKTTFEDEK